MAKSKQTVIEYRSYNLPTYFPIFMLSGDIWKISDVRSNRLHFHNCMEIGFCETDSGTMEFFDSSVRFHAGCATFVGSDVAHTTYSDKGMSSKWSYIYIDFEELLAPYFPLNLVVDSVTLSALSHNYYDVFTPENNPVITTLVNGIIQELSHKSNNYQFAVRGLALSLLIHILNTDAMRENKINKISSESRGKTLVIAPALDYMHSNYMHEFMIEDLAKMCDMSPTHFRRMFQTIMGTSPLEYLNSIRISKASVLLRSTELPVLTISEEVGFRSISSFNRQFTQYTGTTPLKMRKQMSFIENKSILKYTGWMVPEP